MPIIPMRQTITIKRGEQLDDWGRPIPGQEFVLKCRADEGATIVQSRSGSTIRSEEFKAVARFLIDGLADIKYDDVIVFKNERDEIIERKPAEINVKRHVSGKPLLTEVYV